MGNILNCTSYEVMDNHIIRAEDCYVINKDGKKYLDMEAGVWCTVLGHNNPKVNEAMKDQLEQIIHVGYRYTSSIVEEAAAKLLKISDMKEGKCVFLTSGSEAVELGIQMARKITNQRKCICLSNQYFAAYGHGAVKDETDWISIPWSEEDKSEEQWNVELATIPFHEVGTFVFEPGNSSGRVKLPPQNLVNYIYKKMKEHHGIIVVDEVTFGIARTGKWFGYMHYDMKPDIIACGKSIGNGYPVSVAIISKEAAERIEAVNFRYAQSHQNDPLGCRIALTVLEELQNGGYLERATILGEYLRNQFLALKEKQQCIKEIRGIGFMNCLEFIEDISEGQLRSLERRLFEAGYIVGMNPIAGLLRIYPPLTMKEEMIDQFIITLGDLIEKL